MGLTAGFQKGHEQDFQGETGSRWVEKLVSGCRASADERPINRCKGQKVTSVVGDPSIHIMMYFFKSQNYKKKL